MWRLVKLLKLDNLPRVSADAKSRRCLSGWNTAAPSENLELQAADATACTKRSR